MHTGVPRIDVSGALRVRVASSTTTRLATMITVTAPGPAVTPGSTQFLGSNEAWASHQVLQQQRGGTNIWNWLRNDRNWNVAECRHGSGTQDGQRNEVIHSRI